MKKFFQDIGNSIYSSLTNDVLAQFMSAIPKIIGAFIIFIIFWIIAKFVGKAIGTLLGKSGIDKIGDKLFDIDILKSSNFELKLSSIISKISYYILIIMGMLAASDFLNMPLISDQIAQIMAFIPKALTAMIILLVGLFVSDFIKKILINTTQSLGIGSGKIIANFIFYFLMILFVISALSQAEIGTELFESNLLIIIGGIMLAFAVAYGYASRNILSNILASFYSRNKFSIGQVIQINGVKGEIVGVDNTSVTLKTGDKKVMMPLEKLMTETIEIYD